MRQSKNAIIKLCFPSTESDSKKRPETVRNVSAGRWNHALIYKLTLLFVSPLRWWLSSRTVWRAWRRSSCLKNPGMSAALNRMKPSSQVSPCAPKKSGFSPWPFRWPLVVRRTLWRCAGAPPGEVPRSDGAFKSPACWICIPPQIWSLSPEVFDCTFAVVWLY